MPDAPSIEPLQRLLIVVGAHLLAEVSDRPLAYRLRERILRWLDEHLREGDRALDPIVCTDVWYLNNDDLLRDPAIAIGRPGLNAASAMLANRLPTAFLIDDTLQVQLDQEFVDQRACIFGADTQATASAADLFVERYLDAYLRAILDLPELP